MTALAVLFVSVCFTIADCVLHRVDVPLAADPHKVSAVVHIFFACTEKQNKTLQLGCLCF